MTSTNLRSHSERLGPVFGILAFYDRRDRTLYGQGSFFRSLMAVAKHKGVLAYVFRPADIDWEAGRITGLVPGGARGGRVRGSGGERVRGSGGERVRGSRSGWVRGKFPLPDVVYNRIQNRALEERADAQAALDRFERMQGVTLFNRGFLNKWDVHVLLHKMPALRRYLPRTEKLQGASTLSALFAHCDEVFVKPVDGSLGLDIAIIRRESAGTYSYNYYADSGPIKRRHLPSLSVVSVDITQQLSERSFIVQQAIRLATHRGRPFDMRAIVQRGRGGDWHVVSMYCRMAMKSEYRTNVGVGGRVLPWQTMLRAVFGRNARRVARRMLTAVHALTEGFAEAHDSLVAELAVDIGVDREGMPWLIELNSKPVRPVDGYRISARSAPRSLTTLLDYSKTLARF